MENLEELLNNEESRKQIITALNEQGVKTFTEDKLNEYVSNVSSDQTNELIKKTKFELKTGFEKDIEEVTGEAKEPNEPTHQYLKRMLGKYKGLASELEEKVNNSINADEEIQKVQSAFAEKEQEYKNTIEGLEQKFKDNKKESVFNAELKALNISADVDNEYLELKLNQIKDKYKNKLSFDDNGNLVLLDDDGKVKRNPNNNMNPFTLNEVLNTELDKFIDKGRVIEGAGTKTSEQKAQLDKDIPQDLYTKTIGAGVKEESKIYQEVVSYYKTKGIKATAGIVGKTFTALLAQA